jgi:2-methylcitrate dehydratase PrpD
MEGSATRAIAEHAAGLRFEDLPSVAVDRAKVAILDTIGVTLAGSSLDTGAMIQRYVDGVAAAEQATVFAASRRTSPELAALANGVLAHVLDFDDRWHASTHTLPAAVAIGETNDIDGRELLTAYVVGRELRLHLDLEFRPGRGGGTEEAKAVGPGWRGWHETGVLGSLGAATAAGRAMRLDADRMQMALGIAGSLASGVMANFGTSTKSLHAGNAARNGVLSASLAQAGFTADPDILGSRRGLVDAISYPEDRDMGAVADGFRSFFHIVEHGIRIKPYPACTGVHQYVEIMRLLRADHELRPDDVTELTVSRISGATTKRDFPTTELECKFSPAFVAVATLVDGRLTLANCSMEFARRPDVAALLARTRYEDAPSGFIRVTTTAGDTYERTSPSGTRPGGSPARDLVDEADVVAKFHECADPVVGAATAAEIRSTIDSLEELDSVRRLTALVTV